MAGHSLTHEPAPTLLGGAVVFHQPPEGYRAAVDGVLLAHFAGRTNGTAVDLGAGAGMVTLCLLARTAARHVIAVERDAEMAAFLERNLGENHFAAACSVIVGDVAAVARSHRGCAALVVANPPYWLESAATPASRSTARASRAAAGDGALPVFARGARQLLGRGGRACFVWPASDLPALLRATTGAGLAAKRLRLVHPAPARPAVRALIELKAGREGGLVVESPLVLADAAGHASAELAAISAP